MKNNLLTLRRSIVLAVVSGLLIPALLINGYGWYKTYRTDVQQAAVRLAEQNAIALANGVAAYMANGNRDAVSAMIDGALWRNEDLVGITVIDKDRSMFAAGERRQRRTAHPVEAETAIYYAGQAIGRVRVEMSSSHLQQLMFDSLQHQGLALAMQIALSILLVLLLLHRRVIRPLQRLNTHMTELTQHRLDQPITWQRMDEIGQLAQGLEATRLSLRNLVGSFDQTHRALLSDIEQRAHIEVELYKREAHFRVLFEQSSLAIIEWNEKHEVVEWNAAARRLFGYRREQALGRHARFLSCGKQRGLDILMQHASAQTEPLCGIQDNRTADGRLISCEWHFSCFRDEHHAASRLLSTVADVSEKRQTADALRLAEAKFAGAFRCNPDSLSIARLGDGVLIDANEAFENIMGYTRSEWQGKSALQLRIWFYPKEREQLFRRLQREQTVHDFSWSLRRKNGDIRNCLISAAIFTVDEERYVLAVVRDVTSQRLMEDQKAEADHALLRLAQGTRGVAGESFFESLVNDLASALRTDGALIGLCPPGEPHRMRALASHMHGELVDDLEYAIPGTPHERTLDSGLCVFATDVQALFPQDSVLREQGWDSYAGAPLYDVNGNAIGVLAVMHTRPLHNQDLVRSLLQVFSERAAAELERQHAEEELRISEQRFAAIFHSTPVPMFVTQISSGNVIKDANAAFERLFLRPRATVLGMNTRELAMYCNPEDREMLLQQLKTKGEIAAQREVWMLRSDGSKLLIHFSGHIFQLEGEQFGILACQDVTEKRLIEQEIRELNATLEDRVVERTEELQQANQELETTLDALNQAHEELVNSEKLAALGALVAGISHELNTPIGNSLMVASTLNDQTATLTGDYRDQKGIKRSTLESYLNDVGQASDILVRNLHRAADLVNSFKQVAIDQTSSQRRSFSLAEVVGEILLTLWPVIRKSPFNIEQSIPGDLNFDSYPGPLGQVLTNLINNALLHGFEGRDQGTVVIAASENDDGLIELSVSDDGIGIPASHLNRIFDPFFTTKLGAGGSGLGLNITHNVVTGILGGRVRVQSAVGVGTTFTLILPKIAPHKAGDDAPLHP
ncbi:MAG TPA: PAS domain S-box protein [Oxalicibacterium sp.]|nr:PAS domain S-box protein [Oxalicibacterium sp.]